MDFKILPGNIAYICLDAFVDYKYGKETYILPEHGIFLEIPVARPINPVTNTDWEGSGISPDILVEADEALDTAITLAGEWMNELK